MTKISSPSAERNKEPILNVLKQELLSEHSVLEIGSGTGQHACHFASALPHIEWQPTELAENISTINSWLDELGPSNVLPPIVLDVNNHPWPVVKADVCFTCNTFHIVGEELVHSTLQGCAKVLADGGKLIVYGPFLVNGKHTSSSNEDFDHWLREQDPGSGILDLTQLDEVAASLGFKPQRKIAMPANNFIVVWEMS